LLVQRRATSDAWVAARGNEHIQLAARGDGVRNAHENHTALVGSFLKGASKFGIDSRSLIEEGTG
jgi:hypothetical protein